MPVIQPSFDVATYVQLGSYSYTYIAIAIGVNVVRSNW